MNKVCSKCKEEKTVEEFTKHKTTKDGLNVWCKKCIRISSKDYYSINKKKILKKMKNKYKQNSIKILFREKTYRSTTKGIYACIKHSASKRRQVFSLSQEDFKKWYEKQLKICAYCKRTEKDVIKDRNNQYNRLTIDRKNNSKGYELNNLTLCCHKCNLIKGENFSYNQMIRIGKILQENF